jgi:hypothetical protein
LRRQNKAADSQAEKRQKQKMAETNSRRQSKAADREPSTKKAKTKNYRETDSRQKSKTLDNQAGKKQKPKKMTKRQILSGKARQDTAMRSK